MNEKIELFDINSVTNQDEDAKSSDYFDRILNEMDNTLDTYTSGRTIEGRDDSTISPLMEATASGDQILLQLCTIIESKFIDHEYISLFEDIMPIMQQIFLYKNSAEQSIIQARYNMSKYMKKAFSVYDTICVPRLEAEGSDIANGNVNITDILIYNKEDL